MAELFKIRNGAVKNSTTGRKALLEAGANPASSTNLRMYLRKRQRVVDIETMVKNKVIRQGKCNTYQNWGI